MKFTLSYLALALTVSAQVYDDSQRPAVCERNEQTCSTLCSNRQSSDSTNTCDPDTFNFSCICKDNFSPDPKNITFPAAFATCQIKGGQCQENCGSDNSCAQQCVKQFVCNGAGDSNDTHSSQGSTPSTATPKSKAPSIFDSSDAERTHRSLLAVSLLAIVSGIAFL